MEKKLERKNYSTVFLVGLLALVAIYFGRSLVGSLLKPKLFVSDVDLGAYIPGQITKCVVHLKNIGSSELQIHNIKTCCGISLSGDFPKRIPAGMTDVIVLNIRTSGGPFPLEKDFSIHTNDQREPIKKVFLRGTPDLPVYTMPESVDLNYIIVGEKIANSLTFLVPEGNQPDFSIVTSSSNIYTSSVRGIQSRQINGRDYAVFGMDISVDKDTPRGKLHEYIYVKTGISGRPYIVIPVNGIVESGLRVRPEQVFFGMVEDAIVDRTIRLEVISHGWDIIKIEPQDLRCITAKLQKKEENKFELHVSLDPAVMPEKLKSVITLRNSSGDTIQIPVLAVRKNSPTDTQSY